MLWHPLLQEPPSEAGLLRTGEMVVEDDSAALALLSSQIRLDKNDDNILLCIASVCFNYLKRHHQECLNNPIFWHFGLYATV